MVVTRATGTRQDKLAPDRTKGRLAPTRPLVTPCQERSILPCYPVQGNWKLARRCSTPRVLDGESRSVYPLYIQSEELHADEDSEVGYQPRIANSAVLRRRGPGRGGGDRRSVGREWTTPRPTAPNVKV